MAQIQGGWSSGLCDCMQDCEICLISCFCPPIQYGRNSDHFNKSVCCVPCLSYLVLDMLGGWGWCLGYSFRGALRNRLGIPGDSCGDLFVHCCCPCCALAQEGREIKAKKSFISAQNQMPQPGGMMPN